MKGALTLALIFVDSCALAALQSWWERLRR